MHMFSYHITKKTQKRMISCLFLEFLGISIKQIFVRYPKMCIKKGEINKATVN